MKKQCIMLVGTGKDTTARDLAALPWFGGPAFDRLGERTSVSGEMAITFASYLDRQLASLGIDHDPATPVRPAIDDDRRSAAFLRQALAAERQALFSTLLMPVCDGAEPRFAQAHGGWAR